MPRQSKSKKNKTRKVVTNVYFDKVREFAAQVSKSFRRNLETLDYALLRSDLRRMFQTAYQKSFFSFYYNFTFTIKGIGADDVSGDFGKYLLELMRNRHRARMSRTAQMVDGQDLKNWQVFSEVRRARPEDHDRFTQTLQGLFEREVLNKFNAEVDHEIILTKVVLTLKRKQTRAELKQRSARKGRKKPKRVLRNRPKRVKFVARRRRQKPKKVSRRKKR